MPRETDDNQSDRPPASPRRSGPPPRPPVSVKPFEVAAAPKAPTRLLIAGCLWLLSALLALPTVVYAQGRFDENSAVLLERLTKDRDNTVAELDSARGIADALPPAILGAVLVAVVVQLGFVALMIMKRSRGARAALVVFGIMTLGLLVLWHDIVFTEPAPIHQIVFALQAVSLLAAMLAMFGDAPTAWLRGEFGVPESSQG
ncbi:hypothetical protein ACHIPZ_24550 [Antrihabitans sp. NCIMB 15449]|uniref:Uncharacterized protein n=1 Tax=Antrihabitans spumae TaxID=3373370 RepID=A0ABW7JWK9_9NOCA